MIERGESVTETQRLIEIIEAGAKNVVNFERILQDMIADWNISKEREYMLIGQRYYESDSDILSRKRYIMAEGGIQVEEKNLANNKLVHNFIRKLVDQKIGYLLAKPWSVQTENEEYQQILNETFDRKFLRILMNVGKEAINKGRAWLQIYYNEKGELSWKRIPSEEIIPIWRDSEQTFLEAVIRVYTIEAYEGIEKKAITKVEYWDLTGVKFYVLSRGDNGAKSGLSLVPDVEAGIQRSHFSVIQDGQEQGYNWERLPFICFRYNYEEIPLIKYVKSLIDDYDLRKSDNSNNLEDLPNSVYVLRNYDGSDLGEFRRNLSQYRAVKVTDDGGVDTINLEINTEAFKTHMEMTRKDIYEFGRGVDTQSEKFGNSPTGIALKFIYADLDMDANIIETEFQASLQHMLWFICQHIANTSGQDFYGEKVEFIFNRDIAINENDAITNARDSVGILSDETIIANHPWVSDAQAEMGRIQAQRKEAMEQFNSYEGLTPEEDDGE